MFRKGHRSLNDHRANASMEPLPGQETLPVSWEPSTGSSSQPEIMPLGLLTVFKLCIKEAYVFLFTFLLHIFRALHPCF